jgi:hypothetical protein
MCDGAGGYRTTIAANVKLVPTSISYVRIDCPKCKDMMDVTTVPVGSVVQ